MYWVQDEIAKNVVETSPEWKNAFQNWETTLCHFTFKDICDFYSKPRKYHWRQMRDTDSFYHTFEQSVHWAEIFMQDQCDNGCYLEHVNPMTGQVTKDPLTIKSFLQTFIDVLERRSAKWNCLQLSATNNCGKTWFMNMIQDVYIRTSGRTRIKWSGRNTRNPHIRFKTWLVGRIQPIRGRGIIG